MSIRPPTIDRVRAARRHRLAGAAMRWGGGLIALGSVLPWAWIPLAGLRLPLPGVVGWGALTLLLGVWLFRRAPWPAAAPAALASLWAAWAVQSSLPAAINRAMIGMDARVQPLNNLLARFGIAPMSLFDTGTPWSALRGPGTLVVIAGAVVALLGAVLAGHTAWLSRGLGRCSACGHRDRSGRVIAFCVRCGASMPAERACPTCHSLAEPGDHCCGACGTCLPPADS